MNDKNHRRLVTYCILFVALVLMLTVVLYPHFQRLSQPQYQMQIQEWINKTGILGLLSIFGIQVLQIIIAFIPGEPVEILAGALYGTVGGLSICLAGCIAASAIIFILSKRCGKKFLYLLFSEEKVSNWKWLQDSKKTNLVTFILFFIPGTPKDMLTYVVGISDMRLGKFIALSTVARIPSVLSSTMIGSTMRQGEWKISLLVFFITGMIGIGGIGCKDKVISLCQKRIKCNNQATTKCESLDFVEAAHRKRVYPLMYCHMEIDGQLDIERLKNAIQSSSLYVPEVLYTYDFQHGCFADQGFTADDAICMGSLDFDGSMRWDLGRKPQLQVALYREAQQDTIIVGISHIFTDGRGFLQYLYLLASLYNGEEMTDMKQNKRNLSSFWGNIHIQHQTEQSSRGKHIRVSPLRPHGKRTQYFCLNSVVAPEDLTALHRKAQLCGATLNDVFITAYARVIARWQNIDKVILTCPADLRNFYLASDALSIANMTGIYKKIITEFESHSSFSSILEQVHIEMSLQKSRRRCFSGIRLLHTVFHKVPRSILAQAIKMTYKVLPVSYTNFGVINHEKLNFKDCSITSCYLTGTYRLSPDFQLTISTFQNTCTLNCTLKGDAGVDKIGQEILEEVKNELLSWTKGKEYVSGTDA